MDEKGKADSIFQEILKLEPTVEIRRSIAKTYFENGYKDKAIVVLADYLSKNPDDREITSLIKKYQEE